MFKQLQRSQCLRTIAIVSLALEQELVRGCWTMATHSSLIVKMEGNAEDKFHQSTTYKLK